MIKLNLGCGDDIREGYINVDCRPETKADYILELGNTLPYRDNSIDYILARDILEHFSFRDTERIFADWIRVLKKGGEIFLQVPNVGRHIDLYQERSGSKKYPDSLDNLRANLFGGQDYDGNSHYTCFNVVSVKELFNKHGLKIKSFELKERAIKAIGVKI